MSWNRYLKGLGGTLVVLTFVATYRDFIDGEDDPVLRYVSRLILLPALGYGLIRQNVWAVRVAFGIGIPVLLTYSVALVFITPSIPMGYVLFVMVMTTAFSVTVFIPRSRLTPKKLNKQAAGDPSNPYRSPQALDSD